MTHYCSYEQVDLVTSLILTGTECFIFLTATIDSNKYLRDVIGSYGDFAAALLVIVFSVVLPTTFLTKVPSVRARLDKQISYLWLMFRRLYKDEETKETKLSMLALELKGEIKGSVIATTTSSLHHVPAPGCQPSLLP